jgi:hypothetical protein
MPEFKLGMFLLGCCGGLLPDVLRIIKNKDKSDVLDCFKEVKFWVILVLQVLLGGFAVYILSTNAVKDALLIGFTAPEVIGGIVSKNDETSSTRAPATPTPEAPVVRGMAPVAAWSGAAAKDGKKEFKIRAWLAK